MTNFAINPHSWNSLLNISISKSEPVCIVLLAPSNPLPWSIYKISLRKKVNPSIPGNILFSIRRIVELYCQVELAFVRIFFKIQKSYVFNGNSTNVSNSNPIDFLFKLILIQKVVVCQLFIWLIISNRNCISFFMILEFVKNQNGTCILEKVHVSLRAPLR